MTAYATAGTEPPLDDVMRDPVIRHLRHYDGLDPFFRPELPQSDPDRATLPQAA